MEDTAIDVGDFDATNPGNPGGSGDKGGSDAVDPAPEPGHLAELPRSLAEVTSTDNGNVVEHRLLLSPGATAAEVTAAMVLMPPATALMSHHAGMEILLVFREPTRPSASATVWPHGADPTAAEARAGDDDRNRHPPTARRPS
ncbi:MULTISPECIES: hypothetical protein [unclassified Pseudofrankia]|uniref:hypothetical protein n=1 Tax=unclassified Pseudofrankia TaxID=2994372 RepID=UPI0008DA486C|nr:MULTISPECIES: hypothetical protein [unclassified Pseudofrankia]MDT3441731.1 hypothetical protein [Pseudofrankia sp. BMG5.37]OHV47049.1 hypothetical protein BCD48_20030 [Pseudofrankia sp. BMG5.36]